jgi:Holliday junction resolvasome RuvABC endonuclease subunit
MSIINILGIDPSLTATGWSVIAVNTDTRQIERVLAVGLIETAPTKIKSVRKSSDALERARKIRNEILAVIAQHNIKLAAGEVPSGAQSASACYAFGISVGLLAALPVPLIEVTPTEVKLATCGNKIADKEDIVRWALELEGDLSGMPQSHQTNEWEIPNPFGKGFIGKKAEHPADSCGAVAAALKTQQFFQLCGMLASLIS